MKRNFRQTLFGILSLSSLAMTAWAGEKKMNNATYPKPNVLLIQLPTEQNRMQYFEARQSSKQQAQLQKDIAQIHRMMTADFNTNFTFCRIYYFIDTNAHFIQEGNFSAALLDTTLQPVKNSSLQGQVYWIGSYMLGVNANTDSSLAVYRQMAGGNAHMYRRRDGIASAQYDFYLMGPDFTILPAPLPFIAKINTVIRIWRRIIGSPYNYSARWFYLNYAETARYCNKTLKNFYYPKQ
jgi:hypothetical protein